MNTIKDSWDRFDTVTIPLDAPPIQRSSMRNAFYCGALCILGIQCRLTDSGCSEAAFSAAMDTLHDEIVAFTKEIEYRCMMEEQRMKGHA